MALDLKSEVIIFGNQSIWNSLKQTAYKWDLLMSQLNRQCFTEVKARNRAVFNVSIFLSIFQELRRSTDKGIQNNCQIQRENCDRARQPTSALEKARSQ